MRSAVFYGKHDLRVEEYPVPVVGKDEVLVRVKVCGVCGTDVHIYEGDKGAAEVTPPTILGHEFAGIVEAAGENVTKYKKGDRVCVDPNAYCGKCDFCKEGKAHYCTDMIGYGTTVNGGFAEYCSVKESQIYLLGEHTSFEQGAMAEPVACCLHGIDLCEIKPGSSVLVIGGGMIGLLMIQLARLSGAARVVLIEPVEGKRKMGERLGADLSIDPTGKNVAEVLQKNGMGQIETVIECVGRTNTIEQAIELAGNKAVVMMFGVTKPDAAISLKPYEVFRKELTLRASYINPYTQKRALALIDSGKLDVTSMICGNCRLEELENILGNPSVRAMGKYLIHPEKD